ncbi:MAG: hypothetical protein PHO46_06825 [Thermoguttaceae bacterium]|jgi:hypothetical protein|nr:hypothetical protein [Thermoguttaceae bacterium]
MAHVAGTFRQVVTIYKRFRRWSESGVLEQTLDYIQKELLAETDVTVLSLDSTLVKVSPSAAGAVKKGKQSFGRTKGGTNTKISVIVANSTTLVGFHIAPGNFGD